MIERLDESVCVCVEHLYKYLKDCDDITAQELFNERTGNNSNIETTVFDLAAILWCDDRNKLGSCLITTSLPSQPIMG